MRKKRIWSDNEIAFLKINYKELGPAKLFELMKIPKWIIVEKATELGLGIRRKLTSLEEQQIRSRYPEEGPFRLSVELGMSASKIIYHANKMNLISLNKKERSGLTKSRNSKNVNVSYFEGEITQEKAYILGYIFADGNIDRRSIRLRCSVVDEELIWNVRHILKSKHRIRRRMGYFKDGNYYSSTLNLTITNTTLVKDLNTLGVHPNKSELGFLVPEVITNKELFLSFMRGYFDGDGYIGSKIPVFGIKGHPIFISSLLDKSIEFLHTEPVKVNVQGKISGFKWEKLSILSYFYSNFYSNCGNLFCNRKRYYFEKHLNITFLKDKTEHIYNKGDFSIHYLKGFPFTSRIKTNGLVTLFWVEEGERKKAVFEPMELEQSINYADLRSIKRKATRKFETTEVLSLLRSRISSK